MRCGASGRPPAAYLGTIGFVLWSVGSTKSGLFVEEHEEVSCQEEKGSVSEKPPRLVEERGTGEGEPGTDVHGITHETVRTANNQPARRVEGRRSSSAD